jgi:hypothetical protein
MVDQKTSHREELTPDQCIDFAAGLLDGDEREEVLRRASNSPKSEELLRSVMAHTERARSMASTMVPSARESIGSSFAEGFRRFLDSLFGAGRMVPAMAGASLLILGLILGAGTMQWLQTDGSEAGVPARLISLFPSATRTAGPSAAVSAGTGLYIELNGINFPNQTQLFFNLSDPEGSKILSGRLNCQPETGEWAGIFLPDRLLTAHGTYRLDLRPASGEGEQGPGLLEFHFDICGP